MCNVLYARLPELFQCLNGVTKSVFLRAPWHRRVWQHADLGFRNVQSPGLPHIDLEEMVGREMTCKVLEAVEENDRLVLSNRKSAFGQKKLSYNVRLCFFIIIIRV